MNVCTYNFDSSVGKYAKSFIGISGAQKLVPFNNATKKGWCVFHRRWEIVTIGADSNCYFSCGIQVPSSLALDKKWNNNNFSLFVDKENLVLTIAERHSYIDVHENEIYQINKVNSRIFDMKFGKSYYLRNYRLNSIPAEMLPKVKKILSSFCNGLYGRSLQSADFNIENFLRYPSCPNFTLIGPFVDNIEKFQFRNDINLFNDFCLLMRIRSSKALRKNFQKNPNTLFLHAMAQLINFTDANAIKLFVNDKTIRERFLQTKKYHLRFSIFRRAVYVNNTFYQVNALGNYKFNMIDGLRLWVQNALTNQSEIVVVKRLIGFLKNTAMDIVKDAVEVYDKNARDLPVAFHERILREGFTRQMHDQLMQYFGVDDFDDGLDGFWGEGGTHKSNVEIKYDKDIERFEEIIKTDYYIEGKYDEAAIAKNRLMMKRAEENRSAAMNGANIVLNESDSENRDLNTEFSQDENTENVEVADLEQKLVMPEIDEKFQIGKNIRKRAGKTDACFVLPRSTDELYEISTNMRNCVGYLYRDKVLSGNCVIMVLIVNNKFKGCFEIVQNKKEYYYEIVQASGPGNKTLKSVYESAIKEWMKMKNIKGDLRFE
ncbi:MAG: PcfJ domain-containing protein [Treponema sp.]|nr:PcfJ domain-containing protein [Treponema sp.]